MKLAILGALGLVSAQVMAAPGFVAVPAVGFTNSAYTSCYNNGRVVPYGGVADNTKGNFGSYPIALANFPSASANNTCWVAKPGVSEALSPLAGYTLVGTLTTSIPTSTGAGGNIGTLVDRVWRNSPTNTMCIFGARTTMITADHDLVNGGQQLFEVNDLARGGFSAYSTVNAGYTIFSTTVNTSPIYRIGRTFTSVQHRALKYDTLANKAVNGTNYLDLPTKATFNGAINGELAGINSTTAASTTAATQDALVNSNWIDFTIDNVVTDDDGTPNALSGYTYVESPCDGTDVATWVKTGAIRLRQTGQENTTQKEIAIDGYAPPGAVIP